MALSTEWVALKIGQSGSGGVEYSHTCYITITSMEVSLLSEHY